jgi:hypothetical protein
MTPPEKIVQDVVRLHPGSDRPQQLKVKLDIESPWLSGQFDGVVLVKPGPVVRAQFFPDLGGKVLDLLAKPGRIVGYFPMAHEGVDCALPDEAVPHPLLFMGLHLLERAAPITRGRVTGWFAVSTGDTVRIRSVIEGASETLFLPVLEPRAIAWRRFHWMYGVEWKEVVETPDRFAILAPRVTIRIDILERKALESLPDSKFELALPPDVRR